MKVSTLRKTPVWYVESLNFIISYCIPRKLKTNLPFSFVNELKSLNPLF